MKNYIARHQLYKAIDRVMDNNEEVFSAKPEALAAREIFTNQNSRITAVITQLVRPVSTLYSPKQDSELKMRKTVGNMVGIGIAVATRLNNQPLLEIMNVYNKQYQRCSVNKLYEIGLHVHEKLVTSQETATDLGLAATKLLNFKTLVDDFSGTLESTGDQLSDRKQCREELKSLLVDNHRMLKTVLDRIVRINEEEHPQLFKDYMFLRRNRRRRTSPGSHESTLTDISGIVSDSHTGLPIMNATLTIIDNGLIAVSDGQRKRPSTFAT